MSQPALSLSLLPAEILDHVCLQLGPSDLVRLMQTSKHLHDAARYHMVLRHTSMGDSFPLIFACVSGDHELARIALEAGASVGPLNLSVKGMGKGEANTKLNRLLSRYSKGAHPEAIVDIDDAYWSLAEAPLPTSSTKWFWSWIMWKQAGFTPLHVAIYCQNNHVAELLLAHGADPVGDFISCCYECCGMRRECPARRIDADSTLQGCRADGCRRYPPLFTAINSGNLGMVDVLLQLGVPLLTAYANGQTELLPAHLQSHADAGVLVARTALHDAVRTGSVEIIDMLIRHRPDDLGACVEAIEPTILGCRPIHALAECPPHAVKDVLAKLIALGADIEACNVAYEASNVEQGSGPELGAQAAPILGFPDFSDGQTRGSVGLSLTPLAYAVWWKLGRVIWETADGSEWKSEGSTEVLVAFKALLDAGANLSSLGTNPRIYKSIDSRTDDPLYGGLQLILEWCAMYEGGLCESLVVRYFGILIERLTQHCGHVSLTPSHLRFLLDGGKTDMRWFRQEAVRELLATPPIEQGTLSDPILNGKADVLRDYIIDWAAELVTEPYRWIDAVARGHEPFLAFRLPYVVYGRRYRMDCIVRELVEGVPLDWTRLPFAPPQFHQFPTHAGQTIPGYFDCHPFYFWHDEATPEEWIKIMTGLQKAAGDRQRRRFPRFQTYINGKAGEWDPQSDIKMLWTALLCFSPFKIQKSIPGRQPGHLTKALYAQDWKFLECVLPLIGHRNISVTDANDFLVLSSQVPIVPKGLRQAIARMAAGIEEKADQLRLDKLMAKGEPASPPEYLYLDQWEGR
ncbi:hypothetical protein MCOR27_004542 [Pyricularia oryzae]|uniref:F-box domain-containing protein n=1 Tax=Pyricularia grisea TaxID=148305 RepID=A0ABQ8NNK1_PYRGI|nr:hypothetical protein MCOR01_002842 [Pyricularia oryzae]KAI6299794.1 hypothetical protein MCOR33_004383 [Pyricularia grisea]KAI6262698.1 hypothetical protein MCOR19_001040 [Pyricularia oryzae]KAI6279090.1 hypothetical protein MCOR26_004328 [Pyricularia oryzae]KAI6280760.1 hypothetical protein MCOR27_004542 [Pyricularia oryzae]